MLNHLNSIIIEGNLVADPESGLTGTGKAFCTFSIASSRSFKVDGERNREVSYFDIEVWSKVAENCDKYLEKGRGVRIVGRMKQERWLTEGGKHKSKIIIVGEHIEFKPIHKPETAPAED